MMFFQFLKSFCYYSREWPIVHILYDSLCCILLKLLRRIMVRSAIDKKYGCDLASIECKDIELQLSDKDIVIGVDTRKALKDLSHDQQKYARNTVLLQYHSCRASVKVTFEK